MKARYLAGFGLLFLAASSAHAAIVCQSKPDVSPSVQVVVSIPTPVPPSLYDKEFSAVTRITSAGHTNTYYSTVTQSQRYLRLGYMDSLFTKLSSQISLSLSARSFTNEGPAKPYSGDLYYKVDDENETNIPVVCKN